MFSSIGQRKFIVQCTNMPRRGRAKGRRHRGIQSQRNARMNESPEEGDTRRQNARERVARARMNETGEQREIRLQDVSMQISRARVRATDEERELRRQTEADRQTEQRAMETGEQRTLRQRTDAQRRKRARSSEWTEYRARRRRTILENIDLKRSAYAYDHTVDYSSLPSVVIGAMDVVCAHCNALKFKNETPGMCCSNGKIELPLLQSPPEPLLSLISGTHVDSAHFLRKLRIYNSSFLMTSFGATKIHYDNFMPTFRIQGQIYHRIGSLLPLPNAEHKFLQIYFMGDSNDNDQVQQRRKNNTGTKQHIVAELQVMLHDNNQLVQLFKQAKDLLQNRMDDHRIAIHADRTPVGQHHGRYNAPTINEVAILMVGQQVGHRDIVVHRRNENEGLQRISETHRSYDALQYPIMFPYGEDGYHFEMRQINPTTRTYYIA